MEDRKPKVGIADFEVYGVPKDSGADSDIIHLETVDARQEVHDWKVQPHRHSGREQYLLWRKGEAVLELADRNVPVISPALVAIPMGHVHGMKLTPHADVCVVSPTRDFLLASAGPELANSIRSMDQPIVIALSDEEGERLRPIFQELLIECREEAPFYRTACGGLLRLMLTSLYRNLPRVAQAAHIERNGERLVARLRVLIEATFRQDRLIAEYARDLAVSERHLIRVCQQFSERSPMQMVLERRLMEAMRLQRFTSLSVSEIA
jgi:AraC family transcriptional regulator, transcriptional activator of pobA